ncbi:hypothetical protein Tco_0003424 [Tanacetum coccineum]
MLLGLIIYLTQVEATDGSNHSVFRWENRCLGPNIQQGCHHIVLFGHGVKVDYAKLIWEDIIHKLSKKTREKFVPYPMFVSLLLEYMMPEYDNEELTINPTQMCLWTLKLQTLPHKLRSPPKGSSQTEGEHIKKDKGKKALSSEEVVKESIESDSDNDETHLSGSMVESSKIKKNIVEEAKAKAAKHESEVRKEELIDLLGPEVVNKYYNDKLQYGRYYDKMLNRKEEVSKITNCDVLTKKGPITLKVYREDGTSEIMPNFKASDMHLGTRMDYIYMTEAKIGINLDIPLSKQDPLENLNDLANKKRKHAGDIHDYFKANKRLKSSVQYEDHLPSTMLNEPVLGMILFNSYHRQDFVTIEDFRDFSNTMLYTVQEIFFRLHQGLGLDDHAKTFSSHMLAEIDKRNLNPIKQMRVIEQLRQ